MAVLLLKQQKVPYLFGKLTTAYTKFIAQTRNKILEEIMLGILAIVRPCYLVKLAMAGAVSNSKTSRFSIVMGLKFVTNTQPYLLEKLWRLSMSDF